MTVTRVLLHGAGTEARAAAGFFQDAGEIELALFDDGGGVLEGVRKLNAAEAEHFVSGALYLRSPGIPPSNTLVSVASSSAALATTPTGWWLKEHAPPGAVTVTGTKGKSTTSALIAATLSAAGHSAHAFGNMGEPPLRAHLPTVAHPVVELSSYMMHDLPETDHLHVVTCLFEDHLDWHGGKAAYHAAKLRPFERTAPAPGIAPRDVIQRYQLPPSVRAIEDIVTDNEASLSIGAQTIETGPVENGFGRGPLRQALRTAAAVAVQFMDSSEATKAASTAALTFKGLPSRQEFVPSTDGRTWVDDSLATIPEAAIAAASRWEGTPLVLVLGGADRGINYEPLLQFLRMNTDLQAVGYGPAAERMGEHLELVETLEEALNTAAERCPRGGLILFAPAAPSSPPHRNYKDRSETFRSYAQASR